MRSPTSHRPLVSHFPTSPSLILSAASVAAIAVTNPVEASLLLWNNGAGGLASTAGNWSPVQIPTAADDLSFTLAGSYAVTFNGTVPSSNTHTYLGGNVTLTMSSPHTLTGGVVIADLTGNVATMTLTTGTLTANGACIVGDASGSNGTLNVNDADAFFIVGNGADLTVGNNGAAALNITGRGHVQVADQFIAGGNSASAPTVLVSGSLATPPFGISRLEVLGTGQSRIGSGGDVTMTVSNGALADFAGDLVVANGSASVSSITVQTAGLLDARLLVDGDVLLGRNTSAGIAAGDGTVIVNNGGTVDVGGTIFVGGDPTAGFGELQVNNLGDVLAGDINVGSGGVLTINGGTVSVDNAIVNQDAGDIAGTGVINGDINNAGDILPSGASGLTINNGILSNTTSNRIVGTKIHFGPAGGYTGSGTCNAAITGDAGALITATGTLSIGSNTTSGFSYNGDMNVGGSIVTLVDSNGAVLGGHTTINSGRIECLAGIGLANGGKISGDGLFVGDMVCSGELDPTTAGNLGGLFTVQGDLAMNPTGIIDMEIGGEPLANPERNDRVNISGAASFGGTVRLRIKNGFIPQRGQQFIIANATLGRTGTFDAFITPNNVCNGVTFVLVYSSTAAIVLVRPPDADTNNDGLINVTDLLAVIGQWGLCGNGGGQPSCGTGNVTDEGSPNGSEVNVTDLLTVISLWGLCPGNP